MQTFADIWETKTPWPLGPQTLMRFALSFKGKSLKAFRKGYDPYTVVIDLPTDVSDVVHLIPSELLSTFINRCNSVLHYYQQDLVFVDILSNLLSGPLIPMTDNGLFVIDYALFNFEQSRLFKGQDALWQVVAKCFGVYPSFNYVDLKNVIS